MCGIVGFTNTINDSNVVIGRMMDRIRHRGPDAEGKYVDGDIALGHRRLSIIDVSSQGDQPIFNEDGSLVLVFNGEIYNFQEIREELVAAGHIFKTKTVGEDFKNILVDDIIETSNHFRCIDLAIDAAKTKLSESLIKQFHYILKNGTSDSFKTWFKVGDYKMIENEVGGIKTANPSLVKNRMKDLLSWYNSIPNVTINEIIEFHYRFEIIHPFQDGNGRVGRLIMFKECLKHNIVPILLTDEYKSFYYRGLKEWRHEPGYLIDTCLNGQDILKKYLDYYNIKY